MADDISKKITIEVEAQTDKLQQNIAGLNQIINELQANQQKLTTSGNENSAAFEKNAAAIDKYQKQLTAANKQAGTFISALNSSGASLQKNQSLVDALAKANDKLAKSISGGASKLKDLDKNTKALTSSVQSHQAKASQSKTAQDAHNKSVSEGAAKAKQLKKGIADVNASLQKQQSQAKNSKNAFDAHKTTMDHLKTSFDEIKDVSGIFGPSLQEAAKGFNIMKTGLSLVQGGLKGVGEAIKADGFEFLLDIIQKIYNYFINTSEGSSMLKGAISAVGVIVNKVTGFFHSFMDGIINAFTHPIDTLKSLGTMIEQNLINRFKAFGVILDGIIHLDFKKIANGAVQAFTGVTDATDKIGTAFNTVKNGIQQTLGHMVTAYNDGYNQVDQRIEKHEKKTKETLGRLTKHLDEYHKHIAGSDNQDTYTQGGEELIAKSAGVPSSKLNLTIPTGNSETKSTQDTTTKEVEIKKTALQQVEDYAKKNAAKIATDALNTLNNSIKQQSAAKIAALEADKANELNNSNLTSAQKLAIQNKYKQAEQQVKIKAFKQEQETSIAQALINGAVAVTKTEAQTGILGELTIPIIIAQTALQVATIAKQKPPAMAKGGYFQSDGKGAVLPGYSRTDNTNAYLRSGEAIVVSEAMRDPWARNLVSAINVAYGGRDFSVPNVSRGYAVGGIFTDGGNANRYYNQPVNDQKNLANTVAYQMINNFPPVYVDVKDVNNQQNILAQTINRVNL